MTSYSERLTSAMVNAGMKTAALSRALGLSYQGVKKVLDGKTRSFTASNNDVAAGLLGVNPSWLATGKGAMHDSVRPTPESISVSQYATGLSQTAVDLARLFDLLPEDRIIRAMANNAASTAILGFLEKPPVGVPINVP